VTKLISAYTLACVCAVIGLAAACSGSGETASAKNDVVQPAASRPASAITDNACGLLTRSEAERVLASDIRDVGDEGRPAPIGTMLRSSCFYRGRGGAVTVTLSTFENPEVATERFDRLKRRYRGARPVAGLGEDAFAQNEVLSIRQGSRHLMIDLRPEGAKKITDYSDTEQMDALLAAERQIAATALGRLPAGNATSIATSDRSVPSARSVCSLVPKAQMEGILGGPLTHAVPHDSPAQTVCTYSGPERRYAQVTIEWQGGESGMAGAKLAGALMGANAGKMKVTTPVEGVGDEAVILIGGVLNVREGPALITVDLRMQEDSETKSKAIAQAVIARM